MASSPTLRRSEASPTARHGGGDIRRADQIRCLEVPVRQEVLDTIRVLQPCSVREVAEHLGRTVTSLYHHVQSLLAVDLLSEHGERPTRRRPEMLYRVDHDMHIRYVPSDPENVRQVTRVAEGIARTAVRDFKDGLRPGLAVADGRGRNIWAARTKLWLSDEDLEEVNRLLERLIGLMERTRDSGGRLYSMSWILAPDAIEERSDAPVD